MEKTTRQKNDWRSLLPSTRLSSSANGLRRDIRLRQPKDTLINRKTRSRDEEPAVADGALWAASELGDIWGDSLPMDDEKLAVEARAGGGDGVGETAGGGRGERGLLVVGHDELEQSQVKLTAKTQLALHIM